MSQLSRLENEHQEILNELHDLSISNYDMNSAEDLTEKLANIVDDWDNLFGGDLASDTVGAKITDIRASGFSQDKLRELDLLIDPLRYYVIALEKYKLEEYREVVTRAGMVVERVVLELGIVVGEKQLADQKMENAIGQLQRKLENTSVARAGEFCSDLRGIYGIRNDRGPHDVPAAERIHAKRGITSLMWIYYRYLEIVSEIGNTRPSYQDIENFTTLLDGILELKPSMVVGSGGGDPSVKEVLVQDLYRSGFFNEGKSLGDVMDKLSEKRYNFPKSTVAGNLKKLNNNVLRRKGSRGDYRYVEKIPPNEYFD